MNVNNVLEIEKRKTPGAKKIYTIKETEKEPLFSEKFLAGLRGAINFFAHFSAAFMLGTAKLPFSVFPLGTALILCAPKNLFAHFAGAVAASLGYGDYKITCICLNILALFVRYLFGQQKNEKNSGFFALLPSIFYAVSTGVAFAWAGNFTPLSLLKGGFYATTVISASICFSYVLRKLSKRRGKIVFDGIFYGMAALFTYCLSEIFIGVLSPQLFFAFLCVIFAFSLGGSVCGLCTGAVCGIACAGDFYGVAVPLCIAGYISGALSQKYKNKYFSEAAFFGVFCAVYLIFSDKIVVPFTSALTACVIYLPLSELLPKKTMIPVVKTAGTVFAPRSNQRHLKLSEALSSVSQITYNISDKLKYPSDAEVHDEVLEILSSFCESCKCAETCHDKLCANQKAIDIICTRLVSGGFIKTDLDEKMGENCAFLDDIANELCTCYSKLIYERFRDNKTEILASEYSSMARLIKYTSQKTISDALPDEALEKSACAALCAVGIRFSHVEAFGEREKTVLVHGTSAAGFPCTAAEFSAYMSKKCGILFDEPEFLGISEQSVMRLKRKPCLRVEYARAARAKGGGKLSGDTVGFFETDEKYFYALISDGMGSGRSAALTSRLTSVFIEKLLTTGSHKNVTLELLNNLLLSKSDESFATVDLLEIDLFTGQACFVKAGAAPAYVLRSSKLYKIASCTPPAGIVRYFNAENTKFVLEKGDMVVMLSDGIVQSSDDVPWLCEMLGTDSDEPPSHIAEKIIEKARKMNLRDDDMTCVAVRVL